jgi:hypothetical protein
MRTFDPALFTAANVKPPKPGAKELAEAVLAVLRADTSLAAAMDVVPDPDYCAEEQEKWNRAADRLQELVQRQR